MIRLTLTGNTFSVKEELKADGFRWNPTLKAWYKDYNDSEEVHVADTANVFRNKSIICSIKKLSNPDEKKYMVKESWIFNLESMHDKIFCLTADVREGKLSCPFTVAGKTINSEDDLDALEDEAARLEWAAKTRLVTGREYGRIKAIVSWRVEARYARCMANGMNERDAAMCFADM